MFDASTIKVKEPMIGKLLTKKCEIENLIKCKKYKTINLTIQPFQLCSLSNGYLVSTNYANNKNLTIYDQNLSLVLNVDKINEESFQTLFIATNKIDRIYMNDFKTHSVIMTDFEFKYLNSVSSFNNQLFKYPCGIEYSDKYVFVCDLYNKHIHKLRENLEYVQSFEISYSPWQIKVSCDNVACIKPYNEETIYFHELDTFLLKFKYNGHRGTISVIKSLFFEYCSVNNFIYCYNQKGELNASKQIELNHLKELLNDDNDGTLIWFDETIIISSISKQKFIMIEN